MTNTTPGPARGTVTDPTTERPVADRSLDGTPTWVKAFAAIALAIALTLGALALNGDEHGPGRHAPSNGGDRSSTPSDSHDGSHTMPGAPDHGTEGP